MTVRRFLFEPDSTLPTSWANFGIGFDKFFHDFATIERRLGDQSTYPPHNLKRLSDHSYEIELAVAGYTTEDISIDLEKQVLTIQGTKPESPDNTEYLYQGIGRRSFTKTLALAESIEVRGATLENGMLRIRLENVVPEKDKKRAITITSPQQLLS